MGKLVSGARAAALFLLMVSGAILILFCPGGTVNRFAPPTQPSTGGGGNKDFDVSSQHLSLPPFTPDSGGEAASGEEAPQASGPFREDESASPEGTAEQADWNETETEYGFVGTVGELKVYKVENMPDFLSPLSPRTFPSVSGNWSPPIGWSRP